MYGYMIDDFWKVFPGGLGVGGELFHRFSSVLFGFSSLLSFLTGNAPPPAVSGADPRLAGRDCGRPALRYGPARQREGERASQGAVRALPGWAGSAADGAGGHRSRWTWRRAARVPRSRPGGSSQLRASCGGRGGTGSSDGEGTPFSMTMPRRRVQRRRNQRFIGSS